MDSRPSPPRLGELLLDQGRLTPDELEDALLEQQASGGRLGAILVRRGMVSSQEVTEALTAQLRLVAHGSPQEARNESAITSRPRSRRRFRLRRAAGWSSRRDEAAIGSLAPSERPGAIGESTARVQTQLDQAQLAIAEKNRQIAALRARLEILELERVELAAAMRREIIELKAELGCNASPEPP
jgi:type IV pilus assembly protein PilB